MNESIKNLKTAYVEKSERQNALLAQGDDLSTAEATELGTINAELKTLRTRLEAHKDAEEMKGWSAEKFDFTQREETTVEEELSVKGMSKEQVANLATKSYRDGFNKFVRGGKEALSHSELHSMKAIQESSDTGGGFLVPEQVQAKLIQKLQGLSPLMDNVTRMTTGRDSLTLPRNNWTTDNVFTSPERFADTGEIPAASTTADVTNPTFGQTRIEVFTKMATEYVTRDILEDNLFDLESFIVEKFAQAMRQQIEGWIIAGDGVNHPTGICTNPGGTVGNATMPNAVIINGAANTPITFGGLNALYYSIPEQYQLDNAKWIMNRTNTGQAIAAMVDGQGRPLFGQGYGDAGMAGRRATTLFGNDVMFSNQMPNAVVTAGSGYTTSGAFPIIFGDLSGYVLVERVGLSIQIIDQTHATRNQIGIVGRFRVGGTVVEPWKMSVGKTS